jgi:hypothetical protein
MRAKLYAMRVDRLQKLIQVRAPATIIYAECRLLLICQFHSAWRQVRFWARELIHDWFANQWDGIKVLWIMLRRRVSKFEAWRILADEEVP